MSATLQNTYGATPATTRGKPVHLGGDPKGNNFVYTCGSAIFIRNVKDPLKVEMYTEHQFPTTVARYAPSGFYIASGDAAGTVRIWDTTQKEHILKLELKVLAGPILDLQWSEDSKRIVAVGEGKERFGAVFLWDSGSSVGEITGHGKAIASVDMKPNRPYRIVTGSEDFQVNFFEGPPFKFKKANKEHTRFVTCVRYSPDGNKFLSVATDKTGFFYDGKTGDLIGKLNPENGHTAGIYSCSWSPDSKQVLTASADKTCKLWDAESGNCIKTFQISENPQVEDQQLGCLWQGDELLSVALSGDISYLDINNPDRPKRVVRGHQKFITALAHDSQNNTLYSGSYDSLIVQWDVTSGATQPMIGKGHGNQINRLFVQNGNLVSIAMDDSVRVTPLNSRQYSGEAIALDSTPADLAVGKKNSDLIVAVTLNQVVVIRNGKIANKHAVKYQPTSVALSVDETVLAVGGKDNKIYLYNLSGDKLVDGPVLEGHRGPLTAVTFSPDGKYLGSADVQRDIFVWDLSSNSIKIQGWVFHSAKVNSLAWSPDSLHLVSGSLDSNLFIWSVEDPSKRIQIKDAHRGGVNVTLWLNNNTVASAGQDSTVKTWSINHH
jgi:WD40 repeat protein